MIDIQWRGKIGYGDVVSPICYAHNVSFKLETEVNLTFRWECGNGRKIDPRDPETLWERASYIAMLCRTEGTNVTVQHKFRSPLDINHTNYDWDVVGKDCYHNYWFPKQPCTQSTNIVVVNSTEGNNVSLKDFGKPWKDPIASQWRNVIEELSRNHDVVVVDYRTPIAELIDLLGKAKAFVGYHGTAAWIAKFMQTPSVIFTNGGKLSRNAFPSAYFGAVTDPLGDIRMFESCLSIAKERILVDNDNYCSYMPSEQFIGHLQHEQI